MSLPVALRSPSPLARGLVALLRAYRVLSRLGPARCRFYPTCSAYALAAVQRHGALRGMGLAIGRVLRCHPFHPGGVDHVPVRTDAQVTTTPTRPKGIRRV